MANIINGTDTGSGGLITTGDSSDELQLQTAETARVTLTNTAVVVNEDGNDVDFRVEGDTEANLLFVDASAEAIGVGTSSPESGGRLTLDRPGFNQFYMKVGGTEELRFYADTAVSSIASLTNPLLFEVGGSERMRITSGGDLNFNSGYGSVATAYGCRAWVHFRGTSTVLIYGSGNVSSITDTGTGQYTVNFTTAMPDTTYGFNVTGITQSDGGSAGYGGSVFSTTAIGVRTATSTGYVDYASVSVTIHR